MTLSTQLRDLVSRDPSQVLSVDDLRQLDETFRGIDEDDDGEVTRVELRRALADRRAAPFVTESRVDAFLSDVDLDGDGCLTFEELTSATALRRVESLLSQIEHEVATLDPNAEADDATIADTILDPLLEVLGVHEAPARAEAIAKLERTANARVHREHLALAFFAAKRS